MNRKFAREMQGTGMQVWQTQNEQQTEDAGRALAETLRGGEVITLRGDPRRGQDGLYARTRTRWHRVAHHDARLLPLCGNIPGDSSYTTLIFIA